MLLTFKPKIFQNGFWNTLELVLLLATWISVTSTDSYMRLIINSGQVICLFVFYQSFFTAFWCTVLPPSATCHPPFENNPRCLTLSLTFLEHKPRQIKPLFSVLCWNSQEDALGWLLNSSLYSTSSRVERGSWSMLRLTYHSMHLSDPMWYLHLINPSVWAKCKPKQRNSWIMASHKPNQAQKNDSSDFVFYPQGGIH